MIKYETINNFAKKIFAPKAAANVADLKFAPTKGTSCQGKYRSAEKGWTPHHPTTPANLLNSLLNIPTFEEPDNPIC